MDVSRVDGRLPGNRAKGCVQVKNSLATYSYSSAVGIPSIRLREGVLCAWMHVVCSLSTEFLTLHPNTHIHHVLS